LHLYKVVGNPYGGSNPLTISKSGVFNKQKKEIMVGEKKSH